ncbi:MAG TPA: TonB-dependent receptor [Pyrinomonadaceae bacterium]
MSYQPGSPARWILSFALSLVAGLMFQATPAMAQDTVTGAFEGTVTNSQTGAPVPGASVQLINQLSEVPIAKRTDPQGKFYQGLLPPGTYTIRVSAPGFKTREVEQRLLATRPNQVVPVPIVLDPEGTAATTTPTPTPSPGASPQPTPSTTAVGPGGVEETSIVADINTTDARRGGAFTDKEVSTLPLGASTLTRSFDELALLIPGVADPPQTLGVASGPGVGPGVGSAGQFSVNGLRSRSNNFTVDGSDNNDEDIGVRRQGFFALVPQPIESIQEFQIITLLAPAQFGRNMGAQVNAISKSGGNRVHGTFYGFFNPKETNSRNFFDTLSQGVAPVTSEEGIPVFINTAMCDNLPWAAGCNPLRVRNDAAGEDPFRLLHGGFTLGGPIFRDKWYFFFSGEGQSLHARREVNFAVPTVDQRGLFGTGATGISSTPFTAQCTPLNFVGRCAFPTSFAGDAVFSFFPFPNNPTGVYGANTFSQQLPADARGTILSAKTDVNFKAFDRQQALTIRYNFTDDRRIIPVTGGALFSSLEPRVRTQNISTFLNSELTGPNSTSPMFNQLRLSYGRTRLIFDEVRDQEFLLPTERDFANPDDARFLLNVPLLSNLTLPNLAPIFPFNNPFCPTPNSACYGFTGTTTENDPDSGIGPIGQLNIAGFSPVGVDVFNFPQRRVNNTYQVADNLSWRLGNHSLIFGTDIRRTELNSDLPRNSRPLITFNGAPRIVCLNATCTDLDFAANIDAPVPFILPEDFAAAGAPSGVFQSLALPGRDAQIRLRYYQLNFFVQDEWRIRRNFSLSFGLRYEYNTVPRESSQAIERTFNDPLLDIRHSVNDQPLVAGLKNFIEGRTQIFDADKNNFAPRVGFAWSPNLFGSDKMTVIRAGYGLFYDQILGAVVSQSRNVFPTFTTVNLGGGCCGAAFNLFNPLNTTLGGVPIIQPGTVNTINPALPFDTLLQTLFDFFPRAGTGRPFGATLPKRKLETPMAHHFAITFEQQLGRNMVVSAGYVGTRGRNLLRFTSPNLGPNYLVVPTDISLFGFQPTLFGTTFDPGAITPSATLSPNRGRPITTIGPVNIFEATGRSDYDALQLQLRGRFRRKLQYQVAYTFSKSNDDVSDVFDLAGASALPQNSLTFAGEYGPSNFDARHRFSYNFIWDLPDFSDHDPFFRQVFGNLQIAGTGRFQTGQPFTVNSIFDVNLDGNLTDRLNTTNGIQLTGDRRQPIRVASEADRLDGSLLAQIGQDGQVGRNSFRAGNILELDLAVIKNFEITEKSRLQFRVDIFNFLNRANFGIPVRFLEAPGFGQATDTVTPGRRIQFALKFSF